MARGVLADPGPLRGVHAAAVRIVVITTLILIVVGAVLGSAVGYGLSRLVRAALGSLEF